MVTSYSWQQLPYYLLLLVPSLTNAQNTAHQTIFSPDSFRQMKPCAQSCIFYHNYDNCYKDIIASALQCPYWPCTASDLVGANINCYCRPDNQVVARSHLTSCIKQGCTVGDVMVDVKIAVDMYNAYCTSNGEFATAPATTSATTTGVQTPTSNGEAAGRTSTVYVTVVSSGSKVASGAWSVGLFLVLFTSSGTVLSLTGCTIEHPRCHQLRQVTMQPHIRRYPRVSQSFLVLQAPHPLRRRILHQLQHLCWKLEVVEEVWVPVIRLRLELD